ncbi:LON peptidase substrate-binding domain-containing protein [Pelagibacterales bacterium SAG-MED31]|nr:LON peptidase substrate-binding domain-containing protein [Pelagibacterales bacterium SAG-MED31]
MKIPIFPLNGAVLFPKTNLPLNIFEERYIEMIDYSLSGNRYIGMVQQKQNNDLYDVGCFGKITVFNETPDKKYLINLEGINCFKILKEVETDHKFRICEIKIMDRLSNGTLHEDLKPKILENFKKYNYYKNININLDEISDLNLIDLLKLIVMISPFDVSVKQMLLEQKSNKEFYENVLSALKIEMASREKTTSIN